MSVSNSAGAVRRLVASVAILLSTTVPVAAEPPLALPAGSAAAPEVTETGTAETGSTETGAAAAQATPPDGRRFDVTAYGAKADGKSLDSPAINAAIDAAAAVGGGTVAFKPGQYLSTSIRLRSHVTLALEKGAVIIAAKPSDTARYDPPEPNEWDRYQDFGHSHWHNALISGEGLTDIGIVGPGIIWGRGLVKGADEVPLSAKVQIDRNAASSSQAPGADAADAIPPGWADKAISLKSCRDVVIRDIAVRHGGHFAILTTGVENLLIESVRIDTNRDGINVDAGRNVRILNTEVNSPNDDAICLKSSFALGRAQPTENVTIDGCRVSGYDEGTMFDGTRRKKQKKRLGPTGRIKLGTESNGGFRNITITNSEFAHCRGLAIESVDGGAVENVHVENIRMHDIFTAPIFLRLGERLRGPKGATVGPFRNVSLRNITVTGADAPYGSIVSGTPGHAIEELTLSNIRIEYQGGSKKMPAIYPPEKENDYPEPDMFGAIPAYGLFLRHVRKVTLDGLTFTTLRPDRRPPFVFLDVQDAALSSISAAHGGGVPSFELREVTGFTLRGSAPLPDLQLEQVVEKSF